MSSCHIDRGEGLVTREAPTGRHIFKPLRQFRPKGWHTAADGSGSFKAQTRASWSATASSVLWTSRATEVSKQKLSERSGLGHEGGLMDLLKTAS